MCMVHGTKVSSIASGPWRVMDHPDHNQGPVKTRMMTSEEIAKYGVPTKPKFNIERIDDMTENLKITTERLIEFCKEYGTNSKAAEIIAEKTRLTKRQIENMISHRNIKAKLKDEYVEFAKKSSEVPKTEIKTVGADECTEHGPDCKITQRKGYKEHSLGLPSKDEPAKKESEPVITADIIATFEEKLDPRTQGKGIGINFSNIDDMPFTTLSQTKPRLRPKALISQCINGIEYALMNENLEIFIGSTSVLQIDWKDLDDFIKDLQEVKDIAEV